MEQNSAEFNVLSAECPTRQVLDLIADKWTVLIVYVLSDGMKRYNELNRMIEGISQTMLTQTLRRLEQDGIVHRQIYAVVPPKVEYSLTELGETLIPLFDEMTKWSVNHMYDVMNSREKQQQNSET